MKFQIEMDDTQHKSPHNCQKSDNKTHRIERGKKKPEFFEVWRKGVRRRGVRVLRSGAWGLGPGLG